MELCNLENLNINASAREFEDFLERFEIWCLTKKDMKEEKKSAFFLNFVGKDAYALIKNLAFPDTPIALSYEVIKGLLLQHVKPINFEAAERAKFDCLVRPEHQSIREFILELQTQAAKCNYGEQLLIHLRDRLIAGINSTDLKQKLLLLPNPTFQTVRVVCEQYQDDRAIMKPEVQ